MQAGMYTASEQPCKHEYKDSPRVLFHLPTMDTMYFLCTLFTLFLLYTLSTVSIYTYHLQLKVPA
jgi:hypothetical protein